MPLSIAVLRAPFSTIKILFDRGGSVEHGQLLHWAVLREPPDCLEVIDFLLDKGAPINDVMYQHRLKDYFQMRPFGLDTPLHSTANEGRLDVVKHLLEKGADPLVKDARGEPAMEWAEFEGHSAVVELLRPLAFPFGPRHDFTDGPGIRFIRG
jgi:Ankyrin repeats (3 copies)